MEITGLPSMALVKKMNKAKEKVEEGNHSHPDDYQLHEPVPMAARFLTREPVGDLIVETDYIKVKSERMNLDPDNLTYNQFMRLCHEHPKVYMYPFGQIVSGILQFVKPELFAKAQKERMDPYWFEHGTEGLRVRVAWIIANWGGSTR